ncbi:MAG: hypothetical protein ACRDTG_06030 [Pseudonocardiaceae bacterium]
MAQVDMALLYAALDAHRVARGLSWRQAELAPGGHRDRTEPQHHVTHGQRSPT